MSLEPPDRAPGRLDSTVRAIGNARHANQHSILDQNSSSLPAMEGDMPGTSARRTCARSVSAGIAAANALLPKSAEPGPALSRREDGGRSLAEMAHADLDAALQLLAERAQYITGASGAAIALRRGELNHDMLCRASAGSNAPELGALLSMEYGLSGESVRTRQASALRRCRTRSPREPRYLPGAGDCFCRGNADGKRQPMCLGVFELFSGKPRAFDERDLSALVRLAKWWKPP
jgi:hypothetical protein